MDNQAPTLKIKGIKKSFGDFEALRRVDAIIFPGKISAFVGPNGAGKTTLFHVISGNLKPDIGSITLNQKNIVGLAPWEIARLGMGKLFQDVRVFKNMSTLENVCVALMKPKEQGLLSALHPRKNRQLEKKYQEEAMYWLEYVGLEDMADKAGGELSFGQQKLLSIARLVACRSTCLLLDEPTAALSPTMLNKMMMLIIKLVEERNISIALIEHNMDVVKELAYYIYFMHEGGIYCHGTQKCVLENPEVRELYMGLDIGIPKL